jgi:hypothetical protein
MTEYNHETLLEFLSPRFEEDISWLSHLAYRKAVTLFTGVGLLNN